MMCHPKRGLSDRVAVEKECPDCNEWISSQGFITHLKKIHGFDDEEQIGHIAETAPQRKVGGEAGAPSPSVTPDPPPPPAPGHIDEKSTQDPAEQPKAPPEDDGPIRSPEDRMYEKMARQLEAELEIAPGIGKDTKVGRFIVTRFRGDPEFYSSNQSELFRLIGISSNIKPDVITAVVNSVFNIQEEYNLPIKNALRAMPTHKVPWGGQAMIPPMMGQSMMNPGVVYVDPYGRPVSGYPPSDMGYGMMSNPMGQNGAAGLDKVVESMNQKLETYQKENDQKRVTEAIQHKEEMDRVDRERKEEREKNERDKKDTETNTKIDKMSDAMISLKDSFQDTLQNMKEETRSSIGGLAGEHDRQITDTKDGIRELIDSIKDRDHKTEKENLDRQHRDELRDQENKNDKRFQDIKDEVRKANENPPKSLVEQMQEVKVFQETVGGIASDLGYSKSSGGKGDILGSTVVKAVETVEKLVDAAITGGDNSLIRSAPVGEFHAINPDKVEMLKENAIRQKEAREKAMQQELDTLAAEKNRLENEQVNLIRKAKIEMEKKEAPKAPEKPVAPAVIVEKPKDIKPMETPKKPEESKKEPMVIEKVTIKPLPEKKTISKKKPEKKTEKKISKKKVVSKIKIIPPKPTKETKKSEELIKHG